MPASLAQDLERIEGVDIAFGERLAPFTTFKVGGPAEILLRVHTKSALLNVAAITALSRGCDIVVIGQGSNLLIADEGFAGLVVVCDDEFTTWTADHTLVTAGCAVKLPVLARQVARLGLRGLEWMVGVPGSVGGAVRMNAGGHGSEVATNLVSATIVDLRTGVSRTALPDDLSLSYRHSSVEPHEIVVSASFLCTEGDAEESDREMTEIVRWRREHQPGGANCGSVFTNPPGDSAGRLIDVSGLRGFAVGTASVSTKHANFIQAAPDATSADIWQLITTVRQVVFEKHGIELHPEVRTVGFDASLPQLGTSPTGARASDTEIALPLALEPTTSEETQ